MTRLDNGSPTAIREVLIVDDVPENLRLLSTLLKSIGYYVRCAVGGKMALKSIQLSPPDLILLDIMMPDMNGFEVCQHLKADCLTANIPVIFVSALDSPAHREQALLAGGSGYITKPYRLPELMNKVDAALNLLAA